MAEPYRIKLFRQYPDGGQVLIREWEANRAGVWSDFMIDQPPVSATFIYNLVVINTNSSTGGGISRTTLLAVSLKR